MSLTKLVELASITSSSSVFTSGILSHNFNKEVIRIKTVTKKENKKEKKKLLGNRFGLRKVPAYC
jgi:hypothetical protein